MRKIASETQMDGRFLAMKQRMDPRFAIVDQRFEALDQKFDRLFWLIGTQAMTLASALGAFSAMVVAQFD